jgi:Carboxypeptidase regulatory-like domain
MKQQLPGVTVVAKTGGVERTTTADAGGCDELRDLPTGAYRVTARLAGFDNVTRDGVTIPSTGLRSAFLDDVDDRPRDRLRFLVRYEVTGASENALVHQPGKAGTFSRRYVRWWDAERVVAAV